METVKNLTSGQKFMLDSVTPAIYIGRGGYRSSDSVPLMAGDRHIGTTEVLNFHPTDGYVIAWWYNSEWFLSSYDKLVKEYPRDTWIDSWSNDAEIAIMQGKKHIRNNSNR